MTASVGEILWRPSPERAAGSLLQRFADRAPGASDTYEELWNWSIDDLGGFWELVWHDAGVVSSRSYDRPVGELAMPGTEWFPGARLNFAENLLRRRDTAPAIVGAGEGRDDEWVTFAELAVRVARAQRGLAELGVGVGDRVAGLLPNAVETVVAMLATTALGAVWSSCSPDFGPAGIVDRFGQIRPRVLFAVDGYRYNGTTHHLGDKVAEVCDRIRDIHDVVAVDFVGAGPPVERATPFARLCDNDAREPTFEQLPFDHPVYILYSSGTTGLPKSIVHGAGGTLLKHASEHRLHADIHPGDRVFWFTTCGWMMWNWLVSALASEAAIVCYDGGPATPDRAALWDLAERTGTTHFGTSPKYLAAMAKAGVTPGSIADLSAVRSVLSTGSPLAPEQFDWAYAHVKGDMQLSSVSGGTDLIGCFAGGVPTLPVRRGELQARSLGMAVEAWDPRGRPVVGGKGELVCTRPFPSMPVGFWDDPDGSRYRAAYFEEHPGVWTHGDFIEIRPSGGVVIYGRSDTTLNPGGVRIGTAEIYRAVEPMPEVADSVVVGRPVGDDVEVVLFVVLSEGTTLDEDLVRRVKRRIREATTPRHVPRRVYAVSAVPYTRSGKKVEKAVRSAIAGDPVDNRDALENADALDEYAGLFEGDHATG